MTVTSEAELMIVNAKITTLDPEVPDAEVLAVRDGRVLAVGGAEVRAAYGGVGTRVVDAAGRRVVPGLNDSHIHVIRGGLSYAAELRWDGVRSLSDALLLLKSQAERTPAPQWVRVVGGWSAFQFAERRMPTLDELNHAAPDTPVFVLHLYQSALLNRAALRVLGYDSDPPTFPGGEIQRDRRGNVTGLIVARPNAALLYATLGKAPRLEPPDATTSTRMFLRELNRLGVTSAIDAGGGAQNFPDDYSVVEGLARDGDLTVRIAYNIFAQRVGKELEDYRGWTGMIGPDSDTARDRMYRFNGAGENVLWAAADFENFLEPRPVLPESMESDLADVIRTLVDARWPFRLHATYDESIGRFLDVIEAVDREQPLDGLRWIIDHAETLAPRNIDRIAALGGAVAVQDRMAFQGEHYVDRYGAHAARATPPITQLLAAGVPVGAGTDATRVSSYNPWTALQWMVTGRTVGGLPITDGDDLLDRRRALELFTAGSAALSGEDADKGRLSPGHLADLAVLDADYLTVPAEQIGATQSVLTVLGGNVVHGAAEFAPLAPPAPAPAPAWSPYTDHDLSLGHRPTGPVDNCFLP